MTIALVTPALRMAPETPFVIRDKFTGRIRQVKKSKCRHFKARELVCGVWSSWRRVNLLTMLEFLLVRDRAFDLGIVGVGQERYGARALVVVKKGDGFAIYKGQDCDGGAVWHSNAVAELCRFAKAA